MDPFWMNLLSGKLLLMLLWFLVFRLLFVNELALRLIFDLIRNPCILYILLPISTFCYNSSFISLPNFNPTHNLKTPKFQQYPKPIIINHKLITKKINKQKLIDYQLPISSPSTQLIRIIFNTRMPTLNRIWSRYWTHTTYWRYIFNLTKFYKLT